MQLDLREIINIPGGRVDFDYSPELAGLEVGSVTAVLPGARAVGKIENEAGVLWLRAELTVPVINVCARCLKEVTSDFSCSISVIFTANEEDEESDNPDVFFLDGNLADVDEVVADAFVLNTPDRFLCRDDCKGLCPKCGADLNEAPCSCREEIDPRLAVLGQLLEND